MKRSKMYVLFFALLGVMVSIPGCKDACENVICNNGGACVGGFCSCPYFWEGTNCETLVRNRFIGVYNGTGTFTPLGSTPLTGTLTVDTVGTDSLSQMKMSISAAGGTITNSASGVVTGGDNFIIPTQAVPGGNVVVGRGRLVSGVMFDTVEVSGTVNGTFYFSGAK